ncbi:cytochrome b N-terminal domain-containing protein [Halobaculum sp. CBA1158]|uniref:cytochrome b N-terminal domain-containing protein n=1 Tax=Halobaculum sp. CBA1158 TaxID=2904243 RepID=UPI001F4555E8|nr:cytochrome b N-terminal domain-containing protein [Halobaculum sp. CBA1158]UIO99378.1 cytochrome b N-terminal domain-containing protein [Halobaculum sp. CBA1158]
MPSEPIDDPTDALEPALLIVVAAVALGDLAVAAHVIPAGVAETTRVALAVGALVAATLGIAVAVATCRPAAVALATLGVPVAGLYAYTGLLLPWTRLSFSLGQIGVEATLSIPALGPALATALFGGFTLSQATLERAFVIHYGLVAVAGAALLARAVVLVRRRDAIDPA